MTTAVFFDLDSTLLQYTTEFEQMFERAVPDAPDGAYERYVETLVEAFDQLSTDPYREAFGAVVTEFDVEADPETLVERLHEAELAATTVPDSVRRGLSHVTSRHPTGILTNGAPRMQRAKTERHELDAIVDAVVVSNDPRVAARKPAREIFDAAEDALPADDYVYVGDTYDEDVVGARRAGWDAIHVGDDGPATDPARVESIEDALARIIE